MKWTNTVFKKIGYGFLFLFAFPVLLLLVNNNWIFTDPLAGYIDPWVYTGYILDFSQHSKIFAGTYYGSRLGWILPGVISYKIFPPLIANYVLHLSFFYAALFSFYLILKNTINQRTALFGSLLMGSYSYFLCAIGWDYVDGAGITYFLLTILMFTYAAKSSKWKLALMSSGVFYALMVYTNIFLLTFTPPLMIYYFLANYKWRKNSIIISTIFFIIGIFLMTTLLGIVSYSVNRIFLFFLPSLAWALSNINQFPEKPFPFKNIIDMHYLLIPIIVFIGSIISLFIRFKRKASNTNNFFYIFPLLFIVVFLTMIFWEYQKGSFVLQEQIYASYLIPAMFLAFSAWFTDAFDRLSDKQFLLLICSSIIILVFPYALFNSPLSPITNEFSFILIGKHFKVFLIILFVLSVFLISGRIKKGLLLIVPICIIFSFIDFNIADGRAFKSPPISSKSNLFLLVVKSVQTIQSLDKYSQSRIRFWYNAKEPPGYLYVAVASTYLWGYRLVNENFPDVKDRKCDVSGIPVNTLNNVVLLSTNKNAFQLAKNAIERLNLKAKFLFEKNIQQEGIGFTMTFIEIEGTKPTIEISKKQTDVSIKKEINDLLGLIKRVAASVQRLLGKSMKYVIILIVVLGLFSINKLVKQKLKGPNGGKWRLRIGIVQTIVAMAAFFWFKNMRSLFLEGQTAIKGSIYILIMIGILILLIVGIGDIVNGLLDTGKEKRSKK